MGEAKPDIKAEAVAYVVSRYFGLDTSNSAFYLAAWKDKESSVIQQRLGRISAVAAEFIESVDRLVKTSG